MKDIHHVIKHAKFGDDRLRGSGVVAGQISAFPIDFVGRPYNTLTLPCERVIKSRVRHTMRHGADSSHRACKFGLSVSAYSQIREIRSPGRLPSVRRETGAEIRDLP